MYNEKNISCDLGHEEKQNSCGKKKYIAYLNCRRSCVHASWQQKDSVQNTVPCLHDISRRVPPTVLWLFIYFNHQIGGAYYN